MKKIDIYPGKGWILVEIVEAESKIELPDSSKGESMYGKVLEIGKAKVGEGGVVVEAPSFIIESNEEGLGGKDYKIRKGDIILFKKMTEHGIQQYDTNTETAFVAFDSVLGIKINRKEN